MGDLLEYRDSSSAVPVRSFRSPVASPPATPISRSDLLQGETPFDPTPSLAAFKRLGSAEQSSPDPVEGAASTLCSSVCSFPRGTTEQEGKEPPFSQINDHGATAPVSQEGKGSFDFVGNPPGQDGGKSCSLGAAAVTAVSPFAGEGGGGGEEVADIGDSSSILDPRYACRDLRTCTAAAPESPDLSKEGRESHTGTESDRGCSRNESRKPEQTKAEEGYDAACCSEEKWTGQDLVEDMSTERRPETGREEESGPARRRPSGSALGDSPSSCSRAGSSPSLFRLRLNLPVCTKPIVQDALSREGAFLSRLEACEPTSRPQGFFYPLQKDSGRDGKDAVLPPHWPGFLADSQGHAVASPAGALLSHAGSHVSSGPNSPFEASGDADLSLSRSRARRRSETVSPRASEVQTPCGTEVTVVQCAKAESEKRGGLSKGVASCENVCLSEEGRSFLADSEKRFSKSSPEKPRLSVFPRSRDLPPSLSEHHVGSTCAASVGSTSIGDCGLGGVGSVSEMPSPLAPSALSVSGSSGTSSGCASSNLSVSTSHGDSPLSGGDRDASGAEQPRPASPRGSRGGVGAERRRGCGASGSHTPAGLGVMAPSERFAASQDMPAGFSGDSCLLAAGGDSRSGALGSTGSSAQRGWSRGSGHQHHQHSGSSQFFSCGGAPSRRREGGDRGVEDARAVGRRDREGVRFEKAGVSRCGRSTESGRFTGTRGTGENSVFAGPALGNSVHAAVLESVQETGRAVEGRLGEEDVSLAAYTSSYFVSVSCSRTADPDAPPYMRRSTSASSAVAFNTAVPLSRARAEPQAGDGAPRCFGAQLEPAPGGATAVGETHAGGRGHRRQKSATRSHGATTRSGEQSRRGRHVSGSRRGHQRSKGREVVGSGIPVKLTAEVLMQLEEMSAASVGSSFTAFPCLSQGTGTWGPLSARDSERPVLHFHSAPARPSGVSSARNEDEDFFWLVKSRAEAMREKSGENGRRCAAFQRAEGLVSSSRDSVPHAEEAKLESPPTDSFASPLLATDLAIRTQEGRRDAGLVGSFGCAGRRARRQLSGVEDAPQSLLSALFPAPGPATDGNRRGRKAGDDDASSGSPASSEESTKGTVNHKCRDDDKVINLCANPSDLWYGLTTSDGKPVCVRPRANRWHASNTRRQRKQYKDMQRRLAQNAANAANAAAASPQVSPSPRGPPPTGHFPGKKPSAHWANAGAPQLGQQALRYPPPLVFGEASGSAGLGLYSGGAAGAPSASVSPVLGAAAHANQSLPGVGAPFARSPCGAPSTLGKEEGRRETSLFAGFPASGDSLHASAQTGQASRDRGSTSHHRRHHREHKKRGRSSSSTAAAGSVPSLGPLSSSTGGSATGPVSSGRAASPPLSALVHSSAAVSAAQHSSRGRRRHHRHHSSKGAGGSGPVSSGPSGGVGAMQEIGLSAQPQFLSSLAFSVGLAPGQLDREREGQQAVVAVASEEVSRRPLAGVDREGSGRGAEANRVVFVAPHAGAAGPSCSSTRPAWASQAPKGVPQPSAQSLGAGSVSGLQLGASEGRVGQRPPRRTRLDEAGSFVPIGSKGAGPSPQLAPVTFPGEFKMPRPVVFPPGDRRYRLPKKPRQGPLSSAGSASLPPPVSASVSVSASPQVGGGGGWVPRGSVHAETEKVVGSVGRLGEESVGFRDAPETSVSLAGSGNPMEEGIRDRELETPFSSSGSSSRRPGGPPELGASRPVPSYGDLEGFEEARIRACQRGERAASAPTEETPGSAQPSVRVHSLPSLPHGAAAPPSSAASAPSSGGTQGSRPPSASGFGVVVETGTVGVPSSACLFPYQRKSAAPHTPVSERRSASRSRGRREGDRIAKKKRTGKKPKKTRPGEPQRWTSARERVQWHLAKSRGML
ncbi:hypothetical protein TGARI_284180 [Toxoplasma gondii ARI]|uniref:Uncharacterized protein n=1 Tax=Toxoplasma gondii ARI TaxID=1074872 RepID=A0A139XYT4_TOXGO|nr:hypothetical protein TGARI_284180 [Toxoplasma gondii ARI]